MINPEQLREYIVQPTLKYLDPEIPYSEDAVELLLMTAAHESHLGSYIKQVKGPALGIYQMEPATERDIFNNYLKYKDTLRSKVHFLTGMLSLEEEGLTLASMIYNLSYATAMARVHYYRAPEALPSRHDITGMAKYAKKYYNTSLGKATTEDYEKAYRKLVLGEK